MRRKIESIGDWNQKHILSVVGPTGSGKTKTVLDFITKNHSTAPKDFLLVSVDSIAVYKLLDIGSTKPTHQEQLNFNWAGLNLWDPNYKANIKEYYDFVFPQIQSHYLSGKPVVLVGGSHFYEQALVEGFAPGGQSDSKYLAELKQKESKDLLEDLLKIDSRWSKYLHLNDRYRIERFHDLVVRQGYSFDELKGADRKATSGLGSIPGVTVDTLILGLDFSFETQNQKLTKRVSEMFEQGWISECENLLNTGYSASCPGLQSVGYREVIEWLIENPNKQGPVPSSIVEKVVISHRQLAKRQRTWLRRLLTQLD